VDLLPPLLDELTDLAARRQQSRDSLVFGTSTGGKDSASNVRRRLLAKAVERANAQLDDLGVEGLPERLTPHSLRRTFASLLVALGEDPGYVIDQLGHEKAEFTLSVDRRSMKRKDGERERLRALVEGSLSLADLARERSKGQEVAIRPLCSSPTSARRRDPRCEKPCGCRAFPEWARLGSNQRPLACEASALPLSYAPGRGMESSLAPREIIRARLP
jgi:hypothetical protein